MDIAACIKSGLMINDKSLISLLLQSCSFLSVFIFLVHLFASFFFCCAGSVRRL